MHEITVLKKKSVEFKMIAVAQLMPGEYQPRQQFDDKTLLDLAQTISQVGVLMPLLVRTITPKRYEIIAGERRWRAAKLAGLREVPCMICSASDQEALMHGLVENLSREDLNPIEEAKGIAKLIKEFEFSHEAVAKLFNQSRSEITNLLRLLKLDLRIQDLLIKRTLSKIQGRLLAAVPLSDQYSLAQQAISKGWSSRDLERAIHLKKKSFGNIQKKADTSLADLLKLERGLSELLGTQVKIEVKGKENGRVYIDYASLDILDGVLKKMGWQSEE